MSTCHVHSCRQGTGRQSTDARCGCSRHSRRRRRQALLTLALGRPPGQLLLREEGHLLMRPGSDLLRGED